MSSIYKSFSLISYYLSLIITKSSSEITHVPSKISVTASSQGYNLQGGITSSLCFEVKYYFIDSNLLKNAFSKLF